MTRPYITTGGLWLVFLIMIFAVVAPFRVAAQSTRVISNVATLDWGVSGSRNRVVSNQIDTIVTLAPTFTVTPYRIPGADLPSTLLASSCAAASSASSSSALNGNASAAASDLSTYQIVAIDELNAGRPLVLAVDRPSANRDANAIETMALTVTTPNGDRELLTFTETAVNSGRFLAIVATEASGAVVHGDCRLTLGAVGSMTFRVSDLGNAGSAVVEFPLNILVDPYGIAFDSRDGTPVAGVRVTLIDLATGLPAQVFGDDRVSSYPATMITGQSVTDSGGTRYDFPPGDYRFPFVRPGTYRVLVEPVTPYTYASVATPGQIAPLRRPDGQPFTIVPGSYGGAITLTDPTAVRIDIPLDRPATPLVMTKTASVSEAEAGDVVQYRVTVRNPDAGGTGPVTVTDLIPNQMRYRLRTARVDGVRVADPVMATDRSLVFTLPPLAGGASTVLTYLLEVRPGATAGDALNRAQASGGFADLSNVADALVHIRRETIAERMTIIGRVIDGACDFDPRTRPGVPGVRVMMEDGSYAVTDRDGRYHFEGVRTGDHVVQIDTMTIPADRAPIDCARSVRSGGSAISRFVDGQGGIMKRVDFNVIPSAVRASVSDTASSKPVIASDQDAAGANRDWLVGQQPGIGWLFPTADHNPRAPVIRVAIKHLPGQSVRLSIDGKPVDPVTYEGVRKNDSGTVAVSLWRGVTLRGAQTTLRAEIVDGSGKTVATLDRPVYFTNSAVHAELLRDRSVLRADGVTRPVIALRLTDAAGRPVRHGMAGEFSLPAPYYPAIEADAQQARQLAGLERARPTWRVTGDDGVALVELEPTTASGAVVLNFAFRDDKRVREQRIETWLDPGTRPWTIVGLAEGTVGFNRLDKKLEALGATGDKTFTDGRLALYAKGRVKGRWLMTIAYDSDRKQSDSRFGGVIDPTAYYTVYADRSEQRYDASSLRKLYLKLERPQFYALFGDYDTGIDEPQLARYVRSFNGGKAEYRSERVSAVAFAADAPTSHRRDEIQGNGLSGPYVLGSRDLLANGERITIETRDRLRSNVIVDSRLLSRHVDYDIDYAAGTLRFREPILSRSSNQDPQFIVVDYEVDGVARRRVNAGGRVALRSKDQKLQVGATMIHDADDAGQTDLGGIDIRYRPSATTEIRAEAAVSRSTKDGTPGHSTAVAWQVQAEHHAGKLDVLAYAQQRDGGFGVGQLNTVESGTRKFGIDGRISLTDHLQFNGSAWHETLLGSDANRDAMRANLEYRADTASFRAGLIYARDHLTDGTTASSTLLQLGATKRMLGNRLELDAQADLALAKTDSIDFPARYRLSARYSLNHAVALVGSYEIADGKSAKTRTARLGFDLTPWAGAKIALSANQQDIAEYGPRSFAAFGLAQSLVVNKRLTIDATLDGNRTIGGIDPAKVLNPLHPVASGGFIGSGALTDDFVAVTAGATWRADRWTVTGRGEWRDGSQDRRYGMTLAALRQIGEGRAVGGSINWFLARANGGAETRTFNGQLAWAQRPADSNFSFLDKLDVRDDRVTGAVNGVRGPLGIGLDVTGDAHSLRAVNSLSLNWSPRGGNGEWLDRTEIALFWGTRYVADRFGSDDVKGWSNVIGGDVRFDLGRHVELGAAGTARVGLKAATIAYAGGPQLSLSPVANSWLTIGYNVIGFHDRDFSVDRYTRSGPYVTMRLKFDQLSIAGLGLGRRH